MITRIVKLTFDPSKTVEFLHFFDTVSHVVNNYPGCIGMKLYQDIQHPNIVMTYSHWQSEDALEDYRKSPEFKHIWSTIKPNFSEKPEAWSVRAYFNGFEQ